MEGHDGVMAAEGDFYEDDEPVGEIVAAFEAGQKGLTGKRAGCTDFLRVPGLWPAAGVKPAKASTRAANVTLTSAG